MCFIWVLVVGSLSEGEGTHRRPPPLGVNGPWWWRKVLGGRWTDCPQQRICCRKPFCGCASVACCDPLCLSAGERQWLMVQAAAPGVHYCPAFPTHFKHSADNAGASHVSLWGNEEPVWGKGCSLDSWKDKCCPSGVYYLGQHCTRQEWVQTGTWVCLDMGQKYRSHRWGER